MPKKQTAIKTVRLILGDQLNHQHSWFKQIDDSVLYVMMELRQETDYAKHHIQKVLSFFAAMRYFAKELSNKGHRVYYIKLSDKHNQQNFKDNLQAIISKYQASVFEYQLPDEYRLDDCFKSLSAQLNVPIKVYDTEHFFSTRNELAELFEGKKTFLMESFYRKMRQKHDVLMNGKEPLTGQWNYDQDNRKKIPNNHHITAPLLFDNDVSDIYNEVIVAGVKTIGEIDAKHLIWTVNREQALQLMDYFMEHCLPLFGTFQDAMTPASWSVYHSRLSFALNVKLISPKEVINAAIKQWEYHQEQIQFNQLEGFVRQIIGWREYMRGIYWAKMPQYAELNYFNHQNPLPNWFWDGETKMNCLKQSIKQSLQFAYAHHIQRLMITGNFALLAGVHPDEVDSWYLGIYIDALDWVEITNTRGMSQFADGGIVGTKPYVSSATYIDKMSHYCGKCYYDKNKKTGDKACPFNSLYWNFYDLHQSKLRGNPRIGMMYNVWDRMAAQQKTELLQQAAYYLEHINTL